MLQPQKDQVKWGALKKPPLAKNLKRAKTRIPSPRTLKVQPYK